MTRIPRLSSSNTERNPPKFHRELDSFAEERLSEKRGSVARPLLSAALGVILDQCSRKVPGPHADKGVQATRTFIPSRWCALAGSCRARGPLPAGHRDT